MVEISEERKALARDGMEKYKTKRRLIATIERLDVIKDAALIEAILRVVPLRAK